MIPHHQALGANLEHHEPDICTDTDVAWCNAGADDVGAAISILEATNWQLEEAINLHLATGGAGAAGGGADAGPGAGRAAGGRGPMADFEEEQVRAPLPVMRDRLYGDAGQHGVPGRVAR